jgi:hypothetical protein
VTLPRSYVAVKVPARQRAVGGAGAHVQAPSRLERSNKRPTCSRRASAIVSCRTKVRLFGERQPKACATLSPSTSDLVSTAQPPAGSSLSQIRRNRQACLRRPRHVLCAQCPTLRRQHAPHRCTAHLAGKWVSPTKSTAVVRYLKARSGSIPDPKSPI